MTGQAKRPPAMKWLRLYHEARTDAKLESLADDEHRVWHRLLCFANEQPVRGVIAVKNKRLLAVEVARGNMELLERTITALCDLDILTEDGNALRFIHWDKRQFASDNVTARVLKHRGQLDEQNETLQKRFSNGDVTLPDADADADADAETDSEAETTTSSPRADAIITRMPARTADSSGDTSVVSLCEQVATQAKLPRRVEVMEQLSAVLSSHLARGLSPGDIWRDVLNLTDPSRPKSVKRPSVSQISNWLSRTKPAVDLAAVAASHASNGNHNHNGHSGGASNGYHAGQNGHTRRRQPDLPDPTRNGRFAGLITIASDDGPDDESDDDA